jgi:hypothetical protein
LDFAITSINFPSSASVSVKALASVTAVSAQKRGGVVHDFVLKRLIDVDRRAADFDQRRSGASVRGRRHRGDVGRKQNVKAGRSAARAGGRNVDGHRNRRSQNMLDDIFHRIFQAARRIHGDQHKARVRLVGLFDSIVEILGENRIDFAIDAQLDHLRRRRRRGRRRRRRCAGRGQH